MIQNGISPEIRAAHGHSLNTGVDSDVLPLAADFCYLGHAESRIAADRILAHGLNRQDRLRMHFCQRNRYGRLMGECRIPPRSEIFIVVSDMRAREKGISFYRPSVDFISAPGDNGVIAPCFPPGFIRSTAFEFCMEAGCQLGAIYCAGRICTCDANLTTCDWRRVRYKR